MASARQDYVRFLRWLHALQPVAPEHVRQFANMVLGDFEVIAATAPQSGVGLPRKATHITPKCHIETPDGKVRQGTFGWEDLYKDGQSLVPDGTVITQWVEDGTLPTGKYLKERRWTAPFALANREADYRVAWAFFESNQTDKERP